MNKEKLKKLREEKNLSKKEIAKLLGTEYTTYVNYESGANEPKIKTLKKISQLYQVTIDYLVDNEKIKMNEELNRKYNQLNDEGKEYINTQIDYAMSQEKFTTSRINIKSQNA